jgi:hypothetical protein
MLSETRIVGVALWSWAVELVGPEWIEWRARSNAGREVRVRKEAGTESHRVKLTS